MIEGAVNFRDLGGVPIDASRRVRLNRVFRSGGLHALTDGGVRGLSALGVRSVYDLRSDRERESRPHRLPGDGSVELLFHPHDRQTGNLFAALREAGATSADSRALMHRIYQKLPYDLLIPYRQLFRRILDEPLPIVFNCAAGKDRTGVAAALILSALGVPFEEILSDYLLSQRALEDIAVMFLGGPNAGKWREVDRAIWEPIVRTDPAYLADAFEAISRRSGSVEAYLGAELRLDAADRARLSELLAERREPQAG